MRSIVALIILSLASGCATSNRNRTLEAMAIAGVAGMAYGLTRPENREANAAMYGGVAAASAGALGLWIWNSDQDLERFKKDSQALSDELDRVRSPNRILESPATFGAKIPAKYRSLVQPGSWRVSEINQWIEDGENRLIHQDTIMELIPPTLNPSRTSGGTK